MPILFAAYYLIGGYPVELDNPSLAAKRLVPMPRVVASFEHKQRPRDWWHFGNHVIKAFI